MTPFIKWIYYFAQLLSLSIISSVASQSYNSFRSCGNTELSRTEKCCKYDGPDFVEVQCPPPHPMTTPRMVFQIYSEKSEIQIQCYNSVDDDYFLMSELGLKEPVKVELVTCPFPKSGFQKIIDNFNITVKQLFVDGMASDTLPFTKDYLSGMSDLQLLRLERVNFTFASDFLENVPNLTQLQISYSNLSVLNIDFAKVPNLKILDLQMNLIQDIPEESFKILSDLRVLSLNNNHLKLIKEKTFAGLGELRSLELSSNLIEYVDPEAFSHLPKMTHFSLLGNKLKYLDRNIFYNNRKLEVIRLGNNEEVELFDGLLSNLDRLKELRINNCNLKNISGNMFTNSTSIKYLDLSFNRIEYLNSSLDNLTSLKTLKLARNKLSSISLQSMDDLEELDLTANEFQFITTKNFLSLDQLKSLKKLILARNQIERIDRNVFRSASIQYVDLSRNKLETINDIGADVFNGLTNLYKLDLSHNLLTSCELDLLVKTKLEELDYSYNNIKYLDLNNVLSVSRQMIVDLSYNLIDTVFFPKIINTTNYPQTTLMLNANPINCTCRNYNLWMYFGKNLNNVEVSPLINDIRHVLRINADSFPSCSEPKHLEGRSLMQLEPQELICFDSEHCSKDPLECQCFERPYDKSFVVDCSHRDLTNIPDLKYLNSTFVRRFKNVELHLENNYIRQTEDRLGFEAVTKLYLDHNKLNDLKYLPDKLTYLTLNHNELKHLNDSVLERLNNMTELANLTLGQNNWKCGCEAQNLQSFLIRNSKKISDSVKCAGTKEEIYKKSNICPSYKILYLVLGLILTLLFLSVAIMAALYYRYNRELKVWLYAKGWFLWFVTEEELDKDKVYDVFISYSHKDEDFVNQNLLPVLECGPLPYKVCIHYRDFVPGEFISEQIVRSVVDSRRTLVLLSNNFLESVWAKNEFRTAHTQAISEGRARVVVVILGELDESKLDDELNAYLKTNTYVKWGDPYFWNKLKYALPHNKIRNKKNLQKNANIMMKIDNKFDSKDKGPTLEAVLVNDDKLGKLDSSPVILSPGDLPLVNAVA